jgi:hypothetical protein
MGKKTSVYLSDEQVERLRAFSLTLAEVVRRGFDAAAPEPLEDMLRRVIREELAAAAERAQPQAPSRAHALNCKCGVCKPRVKGS